MKNANFKLLATFLTILSILVFNSGWAKHSEDTKDWFDNAAKEIEKVIHKLGEETSAVQNYLNNYSWKGIIQDKASSGPATLKHLSMNGESRVLAIKPGEKIEGEVVCNMDKEKCSPLSLYRVAIGIKGLGAQTTIGNELGLIAGESVEKFSFHAPQNRGLYQIRFKVVEALLEKSALDTWTYDQGEPDASTTIGIIFVL